MKRNLFRALIADLKPRRTPRFTIIGTRSIRTPKQILTGLDTAKIAVRVQFCLQPECADLARSVRLQLLEETGNELDRMDGRAAVAFAAEMLMSSDDMATMPVRDLIAGLREKAKEAFEANGMIDGLVMNMLALRLEQETDRVDQLSEFLDLNVPTWRDEIATKSG